MKAIVCADRNWGIGKDNSLLVRIPADQKFFRNETLGKVVVMGRKTLESFPHGRPLQDRVNIVLTRNEKYQADGVIVLHSAEELEEQLSGYAPEEIYCIGGESIYRLLLPYVTEAWVTRVDFAYEADSFFPDLDHDPAWRLAFASEEQTYFDLAYQFTRYERIGDVSALGKDL